MAAVSIVSDAARAYDQQLREEELRAGLQRPGLPRPEQAGGRVALSQLDSLKPETGLRAALAELGQALGRAREECVALRVHQRVLEHRLRRTAVSALGAEELRALRDEVQDAIESLEQRRAAEEAVGQIHEDFCCPIQGTMMRDPVLLLGDGHTYECETIEAHFLQLAKDNKSATSPLTRAVLGSTQTVPNWCVKKAISAAVEAKLAEQRAVCGAGAKHQRVD